MKNFIRLAISTCPNDTFTFHALMNRLVDCRGLAFEIQLLDIQQLNDGLFSNEFDIAKCSFHAAILLSDRTVVMPSGSALGYGVGPLLLSSQPGDRPKHSDDPNHSGQLTLCPGKHTTAALLFQMFHPQTTQIENVVFSDIMPRLQSGTADFGVCIHEGRFTWQDQGLGLVEDLGERWENELHCPLPLGGLVASRKLPDEIIQTANQVIRDSLHYAQKNPGEALTSMRKHAQEFDDDVLRKHVELYVNDWTEDLGDEGKNALSALSRKAKSVGIIDAQMPDLEVF